MRAIAVDLISQQHGNPDFWTIRISGHPEKHTRALASIGWNLDVPALPSVPCPLDVPALP